MPELRLTQQDIRMLRENKIAVPEHLPETVPAESLDAALTAYARLESHSVEACRKVRRLTRSRDLWRTIAIVACTFALSMVAVEVTR